MRSLAKWAATAASCGIAERFAPVAWKGKVYFVSDDGYLYCVDAENGRLLWKFRGLTQGKQVRKVIGHGRLVSLWPARGGPVLADGVIYFAAGIWPSEGIFVHAVDAYGPLHGYFIGPLAERKVLVSAGDYAEAAQLMEEYALLRATVNDQPPCG